MKQHVKRMTKALASLALLTGLVRPTHASRPEQLESCIFVDDRGAPLLRPYDGELIEVNLWIWREWDDPSRIWATGTCPSEVPGLGIRECLMGYAPLANLRFSDSEVYKSRCTSEQKRMPPGPDAPDCGFRLEVLLREVPSDSRYVRPAKAELTVRLDDGGYKKKKFKARCKAYAQE